MEDSKVVLRGLSQLHIPIDSQKRFRYIDQILHCLNSYLSLNDVLNLRLVCKEWQYRVDHFFQNQPCYRAYSDDLHKDNRRFFDYLDQWEWQNWQQCSIHVRTDADVGSIAKINKIMEHPPSRNPFVFREITVDMKGTNDEMEKMHLAKLFRCLERFGNHLWYLNFSLVSPVTTPEINVFIRLLQLSKNLKSLKIELLRPRVGSLDRGGDTSHRDAKLLKKNLPKLPYLETLEISGVDFSSHQFVKVLLKRFGPQIRRFAMPMHRWNVNEFKNLFPRLTELELWVCQSNDLTNRNLSDFEDVSMLWNLLAGIASPHLVLLQLFFCNELTIIPLRIEEDILQLLKKFPKIKYFEIRNGYSQSLENPNERLVMNENGTSDPKKDKISTLQTLKIPCGHGLSYDFLRCFPSLSQLELRPFSNPTVNVLSDPMKLREQIQTGKIYESNIWEILPKLRKISLRAVFDGELFKWGFNLDIFEKLKKSGRISTQLQFYPYRKDVQEYINFFASVGEIYPEFLYNEWAGDYFDEDDKHSDEFEMENE